MWGLPERRQKLALGKGQVFLHTTVRLISKNAVRNGSRRTVVPARKRLTTRAVWGRSGQRRSLRPFPSHPHEGGSLQAEGRSEQLLYLCPRIIEQCQQHMMFAFAPHRTTGHMAKQALYLFLGQTARMLGGFLIGYRENPLAERGKGSLRHSERTNEWTRCRCP